VPNEFYVNFHLPAYANCAPRIRRSWNTFIFRNNFFTVFLGGRII